MQVGHLDGALDDGQGLAVQQLVLVRLAQQIEESWRFSAHGQSLGQLASQDFGRCSIGLRSCAYSCSLEIALKGGFVGQVVITGRRVFVVA